MMRCGRVGSPVRAGCGGEWGSAQRMPFSLRMRARSLRSAARTSRWGVGAAPARVRVRGSGLRGVVGLVGGGDGEPPQRSEAGFDRVGPGVGRREAQLDVVLLGPAADVCALVGGQVVRDHVDRRAVGPGGADRLQRGQCVGGTFSAAVDAPHAIVADRVAVLEVLDAVGAVAGGGQPVGTPLLSPARARGGPDPERAASAEREDGVREAVHYFLDAAEFGVAFRVRGRRHVTPPYVTARRLPSLGVWDQACDHASSGAGTGCVPARSGARRRISARTALMV